MNSFLLNLVMQLVAGAVGGNAAGAMLKQFNLGPVGNSIAGIIGGGLGGQILNTIVNGGGNRGIATAAAMPTSAIAAVQIPTMPIAHCM